jgi:hypothetical protein
MRRELAFFGLAVLVFSLIGCTAVEGETSSTPGYGDSTQEGDVPSSGSAGESLPAAASDMGISEEDLSVSDLDIEITDDGFTTELTI